MQDHLYTHDLLALAADIPHLGLLDAPHGRAMARSRVCGSQIEATVRLEADGRVCALGWEVQSCAIGQAAAALVGRGAIGALGEDVEAARVAFKAFLAQPEEGAEAQNDTAQERSAPRLAGRFDGLNALVSVRAYPRRHASAQLALRALHEAILDAQRG